MTPALSGVLSIRAGRTALGRIRERGLEPSLFSTMVGASGGPKWLVLYGLDQVLAERFLPRMKGPLALIGSSIGTWRHACLAQADPGAALDRFLEAYLEQRYRRSPPPRDVSDVAYGILDHLLGERGARDIVGHASLASHVVAVRARGFAGSERRSLLALGLGIAAAGNVVSRRSLGMHFERILFHTGPDPVVDPGTFASRCVPLDESNVRGALAASGAVPLVLAGVRDIPGAPRGMYRDGGIVDYHFDFAMRRPAGLCLFPHFGDAIIPGWFDKHVRWRRVSGVPLDDVVLLSPSRELVARLPHGKIPDRTDFAKLDDAERIAYWRRVVDESRRMGEAFARLLEDPEPARWIRPLP